ncbi:MAG TPA: DCC1-like thiol-disulfide oxidoreductase family protein [Bacteroidia bacterium]|nr:DCC1-like thiol-disulfide oxidoreductase family protein [Bacteroidia bacterium]
MKKENHAVIFFDGVCNFCNGCVNFIIRKDKKDYFRFAPLQSPMGQKVLRENDLESTHLQSMILQENGKLYKKTTAALRIARKLGGFYSLLYPFILIPPFIRDVVYHVIAKYRYRWWGKKDACMIPSPEIKNKFIDSV